MMRSVPTCLPPCDIAERGYCSGAEGLTRDEKIGRSDLAQRDRHAAPVILGVTYALHRARWDGVGLRLRQARHSFFSSQSDWTTSIRPPQACT
jgi:hypothetical protein